MAKSGPLSSPLRVLPYAPPAPPEKPFWWSLVYLVVSLIGLAGGLMVSIFFVSGIDRLTPINSHVVGFFAIPALTFGGLFGGIKLVGLAQRRWRLRPGPIRSAPGGGGKPAGRV